MCLLGAYTFLSSQASRQAWKGLEVDRFYATA